LSSASSLFPMIYIKFGTSACIFVKANHCLCNGNDLG